MPLPSKRNVEGSHRPGGWAFRALIVIGVLALIVAIVLPLLPRDQNPKCPRNLKQIGSALFLYAQENNHRYPPTLTPLFTGPNALLDPKLIACPAAAGTGINSSYTYIGNGMTDAEGNDTVVAYDANHREDGIYVLYGDGHVEFLPKTTAQKMLNELKAGHNPPDLTSH